MILKENWIIKLYRNKYGLNHFPLYQFKLYDLKYYIKKFFRESANVQLKKNVLKYNACSKKNSIKVMKHDYLWDLVTSHKNYFDDIVSPDYWIYSEVTYHVIVNKKFMLDYFYPIDKKKYLYLTQDDWYSYLSRAEIFDRFLTNIILNQIIEHIANNIIELGDGLFYIPIKDLSGKDDGIYLESTWD